MDFDIPRDGGGAATLVAATSAMTERSGAPDLTAACWTVAGDAAPRRIDVSPVPIRRRAEATSAAGYRGLGFDHNDLVAVVAAVGWKELRTILAANGLEHVELGMLFNWFTTGPERALANAQRRMLRRAAAELGACHLKVGGAIGATPPEEDVVAAEFHRLCDQFADQGCKVMIEPMPFASFSSLGAASELVARVDHPHGGLMVDLWHVSRMGSTMAEIRSLPAHHIFGVELNDAPSDPLPDLVQDTIDRRQLPGEGELDVAGFVEAIRFTGYAGHWGVDVMSIEHRARTVEEQARTSFDAAMRVLAPGHTTSPGALVHG